MTPARWFRFRSLKTKLILAFLLFGVVPLLVSGLFTDARSRPELLKKSGENLQEKAAATVDKIDRNLFERYGDVQAFAFNPMARGTPAQMTEAANYYTQAYGCYDLVVIADAAGKVVAVNTVGHDGKPLDSKPLLGRDVKGEDWFRACTDPRWKKEESFTKDLHEDPFTAEVYRGRGLVLTFAAPVYDEAGKVVRVWSNRVSWDRTIGQIMKDARESGKDAGRTFETQVLARSGLVLDDVDQAAVLKLNLKEAGLDAAEEGMAGKCGFTVETHIRRKVEQMNGYAASKGFGAYKGFGWTVLVREDATQAFAVSDGLRVLLLLVGGVATVALFVGGFLLASAIVKPIRATTEAVQALAAGDFSKRVTVTTADEVGRMADATNASIDVLKSSTEKNADYEYQMAAIHRSQGVIEFNLDGTIRTANDNFLKLTGYTLAEIQGQHHSMFCDPKHTASAEYREFWARLARGEFQQGEYCRIGKGGRVACLQASYNPILDSAGKPYKVIKFALDVTEAVNAKVEAERLAAMVENSPTAVIYADRDGVIRYMNPATAQVLKKVESHLPVAVDRIVGGSFDRFHKTPAHQRGLLSDPAKMPLRTTIRIGGESMDLLVSAIYDRAKTYIGAMVTWEVVTEKLALQEREKQQMERLRGVLDKVSGNATGMLTAGKELSAVSQQMSAAAEETSAQSNVVSAAAEQVSACVNTVVTAVDEMNASIKEIAKNAHDAARIVNTAVDVAGQTNATITKLGASSAEIGQVIKVITGIAQQTNLLALNATIEAARAGEAGKGFAVVANEVKELAKETAKATEDIGQKIEAIQKDTGGAVAAIGQITGIIHQISGITTTIASAVEEQTATTNEISRNVGEAARGTSEIAQNITSVAQAAGETAGGSTEVQQASERLTTMAEELRDLVASNQHADEPVAAPASAAAPPRSVTDTPPPSRPVTRPKANGHTVFR